MRNLLLGFAIAAAIAPAAAFFAQQFTLDEARARIEDLEARVAALETASPLSPPSSTPVAPGFGPTPTRSPGVIDLFFEIRLYSTYNYARRPPTDEGVPCYGRGDYAGLGGDSFALVNAEGDVGGLGYATEGLTSVDDAGRPYCHITGSAVANRTDQTLFLYTTPALPRLAIFPQELEHNATILLAYGRER